MKPAQSRRRRPVTEAAGAATLAKFFRGFGDATRLRILEILAVRERNVGELAEELGAAQASVSNHLACLKWCGYVTTRREGRFVYYIVTDLRVRKIIELGRLMIEENADRLRACARIHD